MRVCLSVLFVLMLSNTVMAVEAGGEQIASPQSMGTVTFSDTVFPKGSARVHHYADEALNDIAEFARLYPEARFEISGYSDYRAGKSNRSYNKKLSLRRAERVKAALTARGVAADRMSVTGMGYVEPVADNANEAGRSKNRRVEVRSVIATIPE